MSYIVIITKRCEKYLVWCLVYCGYFSGSFCRGLEMNVWLLWINGVYGMVLSVLYVLFRFNIYNDFTK